MSNTYPYGPYPLWPPIFTPGKDDLCVGDTVSVFYACDDDECEQLHGIDTEILRVLPNYQDWDADLYEWDPRRSYNFLYVVSGIDRPVVPIYFGRPIDEFRAWAKKVRKGLTE